MIRAISVVGLALIAAAVGLSWYLLATTSGAVRLIEYGAGWIPGELTVDNIDGSLVEGIRAGGVAYRQEGVMVAAQSVRLDVDLRPLLSGTLAIERLDAASVTVNDLPFDLRMHLAGTARLAPDLPLRATVEWIDDVNRVSGRGQFFGTLEHLEFTHRIELPEPVQVEGAIDSLIEAPALTAVVNWEQLTMPAQGLGALASRNGEATIDATPDAYRLTAAMQLVRDERQQLSVSLTAHGDNERLVIDALELDGLGGELEAEGMIGFGDPPIVNLTISGDEFDPGVLFPGYNGRLNIDAAIDARWPERLMAKVTRFDGEFLGSPVNGAGELLAEGGALQRADVRLRSGANELKVIVSGQPRLAGDFDIDAPDLAALWPGLAGELRGRGTLTGTVEAPRISLDLIGERLGLYEQSIERVHVVGRADAETGVEIDARADGLQVFGQSLGDLNVSGSGTIEAHTLAVSLSGGMVSTRFDVEGSWDGKILDERVNRATIDTDIGVWQLRNSLAVASGADATSVSGHCWDNAPASVCTDGFEFREDKLTVGAALSRFPLQTFNAWLGEEVALDGEADATLVFERDAEGFDATVDWHQVDTRIVFESALEEMMVESEVETRLSNMELKLTANERTAELTGSVVGTFGLTAGIEARLETPLETDGALTGWLQAEVPDIGELRPLVDRYVPTEGLIGELVIDVRLGGTRAAPILDGSARLRDAAATIPTFGITVADVNVAVRAGDDENLVVEGSARSGDGVINLTGLIGVSPDTGLYADIAVKGDRFQLVRLPDQSAFISPDVTARFDGGKIALDGRVLVPEAAFEFRELGASAVATSDDVVVHRDGQDPGEAASYSRITGQLDIELGDAVTFEGLGLGTRLTGGLLLSLRPGAPPAGEGAFQLVDGTFDAFGREMQIERGSLNFYGPLDDPVVDARATRRFRYEAEDIKLGIHLSGRLSEQLDFALFSEPAMSEADVLSFMVAGRPSSTGDGSDSAATGAALAMGLQSLSATRRAGDSLTLDEISFEGGGANDTAVVAGKRLGEKWYIRYTYGLFDRVGTFIVRYDIGKGVSVEAGSGAQQSLDLIYSIDR